MALLTVLRTHFCLRTAISVGRLVSMALSFNWPEFCRAVAVNLALVTATFVLDRTQTRLVQRLVVGIWDGLASRIQDSLFRPMALHHATALQLPFMEQPTSLASATEAFAETLGGFLEEGARSISMLTYGGTCALLLLSWRARLLLGSFVAVQVIAPRVAIPDFQTTDKELAMMEAKFRTTHTRFRQNLEPIAFSGGSAAERRLIERRFWHVLKRQETTDWECLPHKALTEGLTRGDLLPTVVMSALSTCLSWGHGQAAEAGLSAGQVQGIFAFDMLSSMVMNSMGAAGRQPEILAKLGAQARRFVGLLEALEHAAEQAAGAAAPESQVLGVRGARGSCPKPGIRVSGLDIVSPQGDALALGISFDVERGRGLVVTGPTGSGKSLLAGHLVGLRAPQGLGADVSVSGQQVASARPGILDLMLVPQKPYLPPGGLADQVAYPLLGASVLDQKSLHECLQAVGLGYLAERHGERSWNDEPEHLWEEVLSGGEQQRLGIARCLFHRPALAVLDECTTMVSQEAEAELYVSVVSRGVVPLTISQRFSLPEFHVQELQLGINTVEGWRLTAWEPFASVPQPSSAQAAA